MKLRILAAAGSFLAAAMALGSSSASAEGTQPWWLDLKAGVAYDDNVTVEQLDTKAGIGDAVGNFELSTGYKFVDSKTDKFSVSYDFSQSLHAKLSDFDIQSHSLSLYGSTQFDGATVDGTYSYYHLLLAGRNFLDIHMLNPGVLYPVAPQIFVRGDYFYMYKSFLGADAPRSGSHHQPEAEMFYFFDQAHAYVLLGGDYQIETTNGPEFAYKGYELKAGLKMPFDFFSGEGEFTANYAYLNRNYDNITPSIGAKRFENRSTVKVGAEVPVVDRLAFALDYQFIDRHSNLPTANYTENVIGGTLGYKY